MKPYNPNHRANLIPGGKRWWSRVDNRPFPALITMADAAHQLCISKQAFKRMVLDHKVPVVVVGHQIRVPYRWIEKMCADAIVKVEIEQKAKLTRQTATVLITHRRETGAPVEKAAT